MKKILSILLTALLAVSVLAGCAGATSNPNPLTPVFANGVSPDYGTPETADSSVTTEPTQTTEPDGEPADDIKEGYTVYEDTYVSFIHPESIAKKISYYLLDTKSGASIRVIAQAAQPDEIDFLNNIYAELTEENFAELCAEIISDPESVANLEIEKFDDNYEITLVKYYEGVSGGEDYRVGSAWIYIENSADDSFAEIAISVSANEYESELLPEGHINFSEIVDNIIETLTVIAD